MSTTTDYEEISKLTAEEFSDGSYIAATDSCCSQCGAPGDDLENSWCLQCGYYAKYGTTVDVESLKDTEEAETNAFPGWAKKGGVILAVVLVFSIIARVVLSAFPTLHMIVGTSQLLIGFLLFASLHCVGFLQKALKDGGSKLMDILSPFAVWGPVFCELPATEKRLLAGWLGICLGVFSLVTGGQPTSWMEFKETVYETSPEVAKSAGAGGPEGTGDLESAVEEFAEKGTRAVNMPGDQVDGAQAAALGKQTEVIVEETEDEELAETECVIVGYMPLRLTRDPQPPPASEPPTNPEDGTLDESADEPNNEEQDASPDNEEANLPKIRALVVASRVGRRLCVVGYVKEGVTVQVANELLEKFESHHREQPFVPCQAAGVWLEPKFICRIKYKQWDTKVGLIEPMFDGIVQELP